MSSIFANNLPRSRQQHDAHFSHQASANQSPPLEHDNSSNSNSDDLFDDSFTSTASFNSPCAGRQFDAMISSPHAMDICSPSPRKPQHYPATMREFSAHDTFLMPTKPSVFAPETFHQPIKPTMDATIKANDYLNHTATKSRARSRTGIPTSWMTNVSARDQLPPTSITMNSLFAVRSLSSFIGCRTFSSSANSRLGTIWQSRTTQWTSILQQKPQDLSSSHFRHRRLDPRMTFLPPTFTKERQNQKGISASIYRLNPHNFQTFLHRVLFLVLPFKSLSGQLAMLP